MSFEPISLSSLAVILLALAAGSLVKGITGLGLPLIGVPVIASFLGVEHAVVVMVIPLIVTNTWLLWEHRSQFASTKNLSALLFTGVLGAVVGSWILFVVNERVLSLILATAIGVYLLTLLLHPQFTLSRTVDRLLSPVIGFTAGTMQGAIGISSPIIATYFHALRLEKHAYVFCVAAAFQTFSIAQLVTLYQLGLFTQTRLIEGLLALLPVFVALPIGIRLARVISRRAFDMILIAVIIAMELKFIYGGLVD